MPKSAEEIIEAREHAEEAAQESKADAPTSGNAAASAIPQDVVVLQLRVAGSTAPELRLSLRLLPQHSQSSVDWVRQAAKAGCVGELYRSERGFLVQGRINCDAKRTEVSTTVVKGSCPPGVKPDPNRRCPSHDPNCGCHGPISTVMQIEHVTWGALTALTKLIAHPRHAFDSVCWQWNMAWWAGLEYARHSSNAEPATSVD